MLEHDLRDGSAQADGPGDTRPGPRAVPASDGASRFRVFLSHNSKDKPAVERIAERLKRAGLEPWLDSWRLTSGGAWQDELAAGVQE